MSETKCRECKKPISGEPITISVLLDTKELVTLKFDSFECMLNGVRKARLYKEVKGRKISSILMGVIYGDMHESQNNSTAKFLSAVMKVGCEIAEKSRSKSQARLAYSRR